MAEDLVRLLAAAGVRGRVEGGGVHWQVDAGPIESGTLKGFPNPPAMVRAEQSSATPHAIGTRTVVVACFWYDRAISGLMLGMNPANARSRLHTSRAPYEGPEYFTVVREGDADVADGRAHDVNEAVAGARAWLAGADLEALAREAPFIDRRGRAMRAIAAQVNPALRLTLGRDPGYEVFVKTAVRSCTLRPEDDGTTSCAFLIGQAQLARAADVSDVRAAVDAWLVDAVPVGTLAHRVPGVELERHAEVLEVDPARWHWLHFGDRIADPRDVLAPLRALIETLAASPIATRFYTYSSLSMLCFSASSHYPWADEDLPVVWLADAPGVYLVSENRRRRDADANRAPKRCDLRGAVQLIETMLAASPVAPFFGRTLA